MPWVQVRLHAVKHQVGSLEDALLESGALSVTLEDDADQPILEPELGSNPVWDNTQVIGLFDANISHTTLVNQLSASYQAKRKEPLPDYRIEILEDKDWVRAWMDDYKPMQFGKRLWVCPSWSEPPKPDAVNLMLDPGLAFGTGTHPTTALCLGFLDQQIKGNELVIDYGCGSGILGIAALLLGAKHMVGVDIDPQALIATEDNASRNQVDRSRYDIYLPDATPKIQADIMVANILAGPLEQLAPAIADLTRSGGQLALSGLLEEQAEQVSNRYSEWFDMQPPIQMEDWILLTGVKG